MAQYSDPAAWKSAVTKSRTWRSARGGDFRELSATVDGGATGTGGVAVVDARTRKVVKAWAYPGQGRPHGIWFAQQGAAVPEPIAGEPASAPVSEHWLKSGKPYLTDSPRACNYL